MVLLFNGGLVIRHVFRQSGEISAMSTTFCQLLVPGLYFNTVFVMIQNLMQAQGIMMPSVYCSFIGNLFNVAANYTLIFSLRLGTDGAALATTLSRFVLMASLACFHCASRGRSGTAAAAAAGASSDPSLGGGAPPALPIRRRRRPEADGLRRVLALALPGGAMQSLEGWFFNVTVVLAGLLGETALAAHQIVLGVVAFTYLAVPFAVSVAAAIRVGNLLGAGRPAEARQAAAACALMASGFMALTGAGAVAGRGWLGRAFTADPAVLRACRGLFPVVAAFQVVDGLQSAFAGCLRGMGRQAAVARVNLACFWALGTPAGAALAFGAGWGVRGLWAGITLG
ncbi:unnamed protein product, partial [Heterosigma akashiwo]